MYYATIKKGQNQHSGKQYFKWIKIIYLQIMSKTMKGLSFTNKYTY